MALSPAERERIVDEVLAIGIPSHLTCPHLYLPVRPSPLPAVAATVLVLAFAGTAFGAVATHGPEVSTWLTTSVATVSGFARGGGIALGDVQTAPTTRVAATLSYEIIPRAVRTTSEPPRPASTQRRRLPARVSPSVATTVLLPALPPPRSQIQGPLDALLDRALGRRESAPPGVVHLARLPETPTQGQVRLALRLLEPDVRACVDGEGIVRARITVEGATGRVRRATAAGDLSRRERTCIERALETADLPTFARDHLDVVFPYRL